METDIENKPALANPPGPIDRFGKLCNRHRLIPHRWHYVLALHLSGKTYEEISELSGYNPGTICQILQQKEVIQIRQQLLASTQDEFEALFKDVVQVIKECLQSPDERVRLEAAEKWLKAHGKYQPKNGNGSKEVSAEDLVTQILNQGVVNINVTKP